jgi:hypothetical protein
MSCGYPSQSPTSASGASGSTIGSLGILWSAPRPSRPRRRRASAHTTLARAEDSTSVLPP